MTVVETFYRKYYSDTNERVLLFGINPGRFGGGITGIPFTDPIRLEELCGIPNVFDKKAELSSTFIYDMIEAFGGPSSFYAHFFITAVSPLGFVKDGKNLNYYDIPELRKGWEPFFLECIRNQLPLMKTNSVAFSIGQGKNVDYLKKLNDMRPSFTSIRPLPHPRWVMQYRLKRKSEFIQVYMDELQAAVQG